MAKLLQLHILLTKSTNYLRHSKKIKPQYYKCMYHILLYVPPVSLWKIKAAVSIIVANLWPDRIFTLQKLYRQRVKTHNLTW